VILVDLLVSAVQQTFWVLYEGALFILIGFAIAGAVHVILNPDRIVRYLGDRSLKSAALAALLGAPIPLCSCGVLPTAMLLRRKGASREATLSFLVTTPETGVDSIALTLAFFGPLFAIVRPLAAVATGLVAAFASLRRRPQEDEAGAEPEPVPEVQGVHRLRRCALWLVRRIAVLPECDANGEPPGGRSAAATTCRSAIRSSRPWTRCPCILPPPSRWVDQKDALNSAQVV